MNCAAKLLSSAGARGTALLLSIWIVVSGCTNTVAPHLARSSQASFDAGGQNSGIVGLADNDGFFVTPHFVERYNALIDAYGRNFAPPLEANQGIFFTSTNTAIICYSGMEHFATMNRWRKQGAPPWFKP